MKFWFYFYLVYLYGVNSQKTRYVILSQNMICTSWSSSDIQWTNFPSTPKKNILYQLPPSYLHDNSLDAHLAVYFYPYKSSILSFGDESLHLQNAETLRNIPPFYRQLIPTLQQMVLWTNEAIPKLKPVLEDVSENNKKSHQNELTYKPLLRIRWHMDKSFNEIVPNPVLTKCAKQQTYHCIDTQLAPGTRRGNTIISYSRNTIPTNPNIKWMAVVKPHQSKIELLYGPEVVLTISWYLDTVRGPKISWVLVKNDAVRAQIRCFETRENGKLKLMCMVDRNDPPLDLTEFSFGKNVSLHPTYQMKWFINSESAQIKWLLYKVLKKALDHQVIQNEDNHPENDLVSHGETIFRPFLEKHETYQDIGLNDREILGETAQGQNVQVVANAKHEHSETGTTKSEGGSVGVSLGGSLKVKNPFSGLLSGGKKASEGGGVGLAIGGALKYNKKKVETGHNVKENIKSEVKADRREPSRSGRKKLKWPKMYIPVLEYFKRHPKQVPKSYTWTRQMLEDNGYYKY